MSSYFFLKWLLSLFLIKYFQMTHAELNLQSVSKQSPKYTKRLPPVFCLVFFSFFCFCFWLKIPQTTNHLLIEQWLKYSRFLINEPASACQQCYYTILMLYIRRYSFVNMVKINKGSNLQYQLNRHNH